MTKLICAFKDLKSLLAAGGKKRLLWPGLWASDNITQKTPTEKLMKSTLLGSPKRVPSSSPHPHFILAGKQKVSG